MPYIQRSFPQARDYLDAGFEDVYSSPGLYINNVPVALWESPITGNSALSQISMPPAPPVRDYAPNQSQRDNYRSGQAFAVLDPYYGVSVAGGNKGKTISVTGGDAIPTGTGDPNDLIGNPETLPSPFGPQ